MFISEKVPSLNSESVPTVESAQTPEDTSATKLTPEERINNIDVQIENGRGQTAKLTEAISADEKEMNRARQELGLSPTKEGISADKKRMEELQAKQKELEKERKDLSKQQEKEWLIKAERERILQEIIKELIDEFKSLSTADKKSVLATGLTSEKGSFGITSMGTLAPETAKALAQAFEEGIKLLPKLLAAVPDIVNAFDEALTREATERIKERLTKEDKNQEAERLEKNETEIEETLEEGTNVKERKEPHNGESKGGSPPVQIAKTKAE